MFTDGTGRNSLESSRSGICLFWNWEADHVWVGQDFGQMASEPRQRFSRLSDLLTLVFYHFEQPIGSW